MATKPDFLGIGSTRCGTTTLHKVFAQHPDIWVPPNKELHYFSGRHQAPRYWQLPIARRKFRRTLGWALTGKRPWRDALWHSRYLAGPGGDAWYTRLFAGHREALAGEITPEYGLVDAATVARVRALVPDARLLFLMRDPLDRAWSSFARSAGKKRQLDLAALDSATLLAELSRLNLANSRYLEMLAPWEAEFPAEQIAVLFFEDMVDRPELFWPQALHHVGAACPDWLVARASGPGQNSSRRYQNMALPPAAADYLARHLIESTRALAQRFGNHARTWLARQEAILADPPTREP